MMSIRPQRGLTLIELIVFIVIVGVALAGVLAVLDHTTRHSADPMIRKQALTIAEALLDEVMAQPFTWCDPDDPQAATATSNVVGATGCSSAALVEALGPEGAETRGTYDNVSDYVNADGSAISGDAFGLGDATHALRNIASTAVAPLGYTASIRVEESGLNGIAAADSLLVTVTVNALGETLQVQGYRTRYAPNSVP
jgi:MSHA pilin protein MshD